MMKFFTLVSLWSTAIVLGWAVKSVGQLRADPSDDFSFTLDTSAAQDDYRLMSERRVTEIFEDRLDSVGRMHAPHLAAHLLKLCRKLRFDPAFVLSLIEVESSFKIRARSPFGAMGLMQVMPATAVVVARGLGLDLGDRKLRRSDDETVLQVAERLLSDPFTNLTFGLTYLAFLRDRYQGLSPYYLVAAYNVGPGRMDELRLRKGFRPVTTKKYYESIRRRVPGLRFYRREV